MASLRKFETRISSRGHGCFTINPPQPMAAATRFPSHGSGRPGLELRTATKLSSVGLEPRPFRPLVYGSVALTTRPHALVRNRSSCGRGYLLYGRKKMRFQKFTDTYGQGLNMILGQNFQTHHTTKTLSGLKCILRVFCSLLYTVYSCSVQKLQRCEGQRHGF